MTHKHFEVIEQFTMAKSGDEGRNEDGLLIDDHFIAVVDGATSKNNRTFEGKTGGLLAKECILATISRFRGDEAFDEAVAAIQRALVAKLSAETYGHVAASAVVFSAARGEIWMVGDCRAMIDGTVFSSENRVDAILAAARALAIRELMLSGANEETLRADDAGRRMILSFLQLQHVLENQPGDYGHGVFNNTTVHEEILLQMSKCVDISTSSEIVLATDGYPQLKPTFEESEALLARIIERDPLCCREFLATKGVASDAKTFDDRTYVRFRVF